MVNVPREAMGHVMEMDMSPRLPLLYEHAIHEHAKHAIQSMPLGHVLEQIAQTAPLHQTA